MNRLLLTAILFFFVHTEKGISQTISTHKGLATLEFTCPQGLIRVWLPDDIRPGDVISGSIMAEPSGNNSRQQRKAMKELAKGAINFAGNIQKLTDLIAGKQSPLKSFAASSPFTVSFTGNLKERITIQPGTQASSVATCTIPTHALTASPFRITGNFDGDASNTKFNLGAQPLTVIAESPRQSIVQYPADATINTLTVKEVNRPACAAVVQSVNMTITAGHLNLLKGESTEMQVDITGLNGLQSSATLTIKNKSQDVIILEGGNEQFYSLAPLAFNAGVFQKKLKVQSEQSGNFSVDFNLDLPESGPPIMADIKNAKGGKRDEKVLTAGTRSAMEIGWKKVHDAEETKQGEGWDCDACFQCAKSRTTESNAGQVGDLGWGIITSFLSQGVGMMGGLLEKVKDIADKGGDIYKGIKELIDKEKIQVVGFKDDWCPSNEYCKLEGIIFYNVETGCVEALYKCVGTKKCCVNAVTWFKVSYCLDKDGAVISDTVSMSITH